MHFERLPEEHSASLRGDIRVAIDSCFAHRTIGPIFGDLKQLIAKSENAEVTAWAKKTLRTLEDRSPTSLAISLEAIKRAEKGLSLHQALNMELGIATAYCVRCYVLGCTICVALLTVELVCRAAQAPISRLASRQCWSANRNRGHSGRPIPSTVYPRKPSTPSSTPHLNSAPRRPPSRRQCLLRLRRALHRRLRNAIRCCLHFPPKPRFGI